MVANSPESIDGNAVLGLSIRREKADRLIGRWNENPEVGDNLSKQKLFSNCRRLLDNYSVVGWLWTACNYEKRRSEEAGWEDEIGMEVSAIM